MKMQNKAYIAIGIAAIELAITPILLTISGHAVSGQSSLLSTISLLFYVFIVGSIASLAISYKKDRMTGFLSIFADRNTLILLLAAGLLNDAISQTLLGIGSIGTNPGIGAIIFRTWTIMVVILAPILLRNKVTKIQIAATILGFIGAYIIISNGTLLSINMQELPYVIILFGAALAVTFSNLIMKRHNADTVGTIALFNISSALFLGIYMLLTNQAPALAFTPINMFTIFFLGIVAYAIGSTLYFYSLRILGPMVIGNIILVIPFLTILLSSLTLGTPIKAYYFAAAAMLSAGIFIQQRFTKAPEHIRLSKKRYGALIFDISGVFSNTKSSKISWYIMGNSRALCMKLNGNIDYDKVGRISSKYGCLAFTTDKLHEGVDVDELNFIKEITGLKNNETALVGIGHANKVEQALDEIHNPSNDALDGRLRYTKSE